MRGAVELSCPVWFRAGAVVHVWLAFYRVGGFGVACGLVELDQVRWLHLWRPGRPG